MMINCAGKKCQGFTLVEAVVSMFIFVLIMAAVSQVFTRAFLGYRNEKSVQRNLEAAQFAVNTMAKELRTGSIVASSATDVRFYDYSQGLCIKYRISGSNLEVGQAAATGILDCSTKGLTFTTAASGVAGQFVVIPSSRTGSQVVGKVTISLQVGTGSTRPVNIQTSISLRDYGNSGI